MKSLKENNSITDKEIDIIYDYIDWCLNRGDFTKVDYILSSVTCQLENDCVGVDEVLTYLTITLAGKNRLPCRKGLFELAKWKFCKEPNFHILFIGLD